MFLTPLASRSTRKLGMKLEIRSLLAWKGHVE